MANTFDAIHGGAQVSSTAFLPLENPGEQLENIIEEAQLHRGSLREQDGYTIPFREGGSVRLRIVEGDQPGLDITIDAPTVERREHLEKVTAEQTLAKVSQGVLEWKQL